MKIFSSFVRLLDQIFNGVVEELDDHTRFVRQNQYEKRKFAVV